MIPGNASAKLVFSNNVRLAATRLLLDIDQVNQLQEAYLARGWNPTGSDPIADVDIAGSLITADQIKQLLEAAWLASRINALMTEQTITGTIAGNDILNNIRSDM